MLPFKIARRYLFGKKSTNAINVISGISMAGIAVGSAALILVLSVFNGFEDLLTGLYSAFEPDVKVTPAQGKVFIPDSILLSSIAAMPEVAAMSQTIEEVALFEYKGSQDFGLIKGVDAQFRQVAQIDSFLEMGTYVFKEGERNFAVAGYGMYSKLSLNTEDQLETMSVYMARKQQSPLDQPFRRRFLHIAGVFSVQPRLDEKYILTDLAFAQELRGYTEGQISALEIKLRPEADAEASIANIRQLLGEDFEVKNHYQQNESFLKLMNMEKWMGYAIVSLTLILVAFNLVGALSMVVIDKKRDISVLKAMGASDALIRQIFLSQGILLSLLGMFLGFIVAIAIYILQKTVGIIRMEGFIIDSYPISMRLVDFFIVFLTVMVIALLAALLPAHRATQVQSLVRDE